MGFQLKFQSETIEFQSILALRLPIYGEQRDASELVPNEPKIDNIYEFSKSGYRIYLLNTLPVVATQGNQLFIKVVGMAEILRVGYYPMADDRIETRGLYQFKQLFTHEESEHWLEAIREKGSPQLSIS